jgi:hypothetical protein
MIKIIFAAVDIARMISPVVASIIVQSIRFVIVTFLPDYSSQRSALQA